MSTAAAKGKPVDPDLFRRTAPQWNCVDFPGDGMHYTPTGGRCVWCGMTREQITAERQAREAEEAALLAAKEQQAATA